MGFALAFDRDRIRAYLSKRAFSGMRRIATCGNCQRVCFGDKCETTQSLKLLRKSGCVVQQPDGSLEVLPPADAAQAFAEMDPAHSQKFECPRAAARDPERQRAARSFPAA